MLSVVIPVLNGGQDFARCLAALAAARSVCAEPVEVIVVDDGSTDDSVERAQAAGARVAHTAGRQGPAVARNLGAKLAGGEVVLFLDADVAVHPDTLNRVVSRFRQQPDLAACFGSYDTRPAASNFLSQYKNLFHHYVHQMAREEAGTFWSGCGAIRRAVFLELGGFDTTLYTRPSIEDIELGGRLVRAGGRIRLDKALQVTHLKRWTAVSLLRTDIRDRGLPWTRLLWRDRAFFNDLNLQTSNRASVVMAYCLVLALVSGVAWPPAWAMGAVLAAGLLALNAPLYAFFARQRGLRFAARCVGWHWLYYLYNGLCFGLGTAWHFLDRYRSRRVEVPAAE